GREAARLLEASSGQQDPAHFQHILAVDDAAALTDREDGECRIGSVGRRRAGRRLRGGVPEQPQVVVGQRVQCRWFAYLREQGVETRGNGVIPRGVAEGGL